MKGAMTHHAEFSVIRNYLISRGFMGLVKKYRNLWGSSKGQGEKGP
jgi:hypothetical protein